MLNKFAIADSPVSAEDVRNAIKIGGRVPEEVRGEESEKAIGMSSSRNGANATKSGEANGEGPLIMQAVRKIE